jgi:hypothetical protein
VRCPYIGYYLQVKDGGDSLPAIAIYLSCLSIVYRYPWRPLAQDADGVTMSSPVTSDDSDPYEPWGTSNPSDKVYALRGILRNESLGINFACGG